MGPRTRNGKNSTSSEVIEVCVSCSSEKCPVQTEVLVSADFDVTKNFTCGVCAANFQKEQPKSYTSAVEHTLKIEKSTRAALFSENAQEQTRKESKRFSLVIKGTKPSDLTTDEAIVRDLAKALNVSINSNEVSAKRIGKI